MLILSTFLLLADLTPSPTVAAAAEETQIKSIALYYKPECPHSQRVLAYIKKEHLSVPLRNVPQDPEARETLRVVGGHLIVPCLIVDGKAIYEDHAIIKWLSEHKSQLTHE